MKTACCIDGNNEFSEKAAPALSVCCGEVFTVKTELCSGPWLKSADIEWRRELEQPGNFLTCVQIEDAGKGDMLAVHIRKVAVEDVAYNGLEGVTTFPYPAGFLGDRYDARPYVKIMPVENGQFRWNGTSFDVQPMLGCIGTARPPCAPGKDIPHCCGGNLDVREVQPGTTVYLPVQTEKAYLFLGDAHARQGDGEITGWGAECRSTVELTVDKAAAFPFPLENAVVAEDSGQLMAFGFGEGFEAAYNSSVKALLDFAAHRSCREKRDEYVRLGLAMRTHVAQTCFPQWPVFVSSIPKKFL